MNDTIANASFYGILDTGYVAPELWSEKYEALVRGGAGIVQIRAKATTASQREHLLQLIIEYRKKAKEPQPVLILNDDIDLCLKYEGVGLHVGQDDLPARQARERLGPDRALGLSTHSPEQAQAAIDLGPDILDYFAVGPVFATQTKPNYQPVGLELVRHVAELSPPLPFFCIGGINRSNIEKVCAAGARRIVTVSDALCDSDTESAVRQSRALVEKHRK